jgi:hypothetical protein
MVCRQAGTQPLAAVLESGESRPLELPPCVDQTATTTTSSP